MQLTFLFSWKYCFRTKFLEAIYCDHPVEVRYTSTLNSVQMLRLIKPHLKKAQKALLLT